MHDCIFCRIVAGEAPAKLVHQDDLVIAFRDIRPAAPTHVLIVMREHIPSIGEVGEEHAGLLSRIVTVANQIARDEGIFESGYRLLTNKGYGGGQTVFHLHFHLLGGRPLGPKLG